MDAATVATHAQRIVAQLEPSALPSIRAHVYRDRPDFDALAEIERSYVPGQPPPSPPAGSWLAFVYSKPTIEEGVIHVHVLEALAAEGAPELWIKLKRAEAARSVFANAAPLDNAAAAVNQFVWREAAGASSHFRFGADVNAGDGPTWLRTPMRITRQGEELEVCAPYSVSPLDAPPRFAGMFYIKTLSYEWAAREAAR